MTVSSTTRKAGPYAANGSQTSFPYSFPVYVAGDVAVLQTDSDGNETSFTGATVLINADQDSNPGGSVTISPAPDSGTLITIVGGTPYSQTLDLPAGGSFNAIALEKGLDRIVFQIQRLAEVSGRSLVFPASSVASTTLPIASDRAEKLLGFDVNGDIQVVAPADGSAADVAADLAALEGYGPVYASSYGLSTSNTASANVTALQAAITAATAKKRSVVISSAATAYQLDDELTLPDGVCVFGEGFYSCLEQTTADKAVFILGNDCIVSRLRMKIPDGGGGSAGTANCVRAVSKKRVRIIDNWMQVADSCSGVYIADTPDSIIRGNFIWGGTWGVGASSSTTADILTYSTSGGRLVIEGNYCLSNNSQGIFVNALGGDPDCTVRGNVCVTIDDSTWVEYAAGGTRRHGILLAYAGGNSSRLSVVGNICRNTRWSGIYVTSNGAGTGQNMAIVGNVCSLNGQEVAQPLAGGIWIATNGGEVVSDNVITDFAGTSGNAAILVTASSAGGVTGTSVTNNHVRGSAGTGIAVLNYARGVRVTGNEIIGSGGVDISVSQTAGDTALGGHQIIKNTCIRSNTSGASIRVDHQDGTARTRVALNDLRGGSKTTLSATNVGVLLVGNIPTVDVLWNQITTYYYGISNSSLLGPDIRYTTQTLIDSNVIDNCSQGIGVSSSVSATTPPDQGTTFPLENNVFRSCTADVGAGIAAGYASGYVVRRLGAAVSLLSAAAPATGYWAVGDRAINSAPAVGQPIGWICTVAGAPGTWVAEANL